MGGDRRQGKQRADLAFSRRVRTERRREPGKPGRRVHTRMLTLLKRRRGYSLLKRRRGYFCAVRLACGTGPLLD